MTLLPHVVLTEVIQRYSFGRWSGIEGPKQFPSCDTSWGMAEGSDHQSEFVQVASSAWQPPQCMELFTGNTSELQQQGL